MKKMQIAAKFHIFIFKHSLIELTSYIKICITLCSENICTAY